MTKSEKKTNEEIDIFGNPYEQPMSAALLLRSHTMTKKIVDQIREKNDSNLDMIEVTDRWATSTPLGYARKKVKASDVFSQLSIENATKIEYNPMVVVPNAKVSIGIDPSFESSKFGIVATRFVNERIEVVIVEEHNRPDFNMMIDRVWEIKKQIGISAIYVDAANPEIWQSLKKEFNESHSESYVFDKLAHCKKNNLDPLTPLSIPSYSSVSISSSDSSSSSSAVAMSTA